MLAVVDIDVAVRFCFPKTRLASLRRYLTAHSARYRKDKFLVDMVKGNKGQFSAKMLQVANQAGVPPSTREAFEETVAKFITEAST
jgi:hypothetical protein